MHHSVYFEPLASLFTSLAVLTFLMAALKKCINTV